ncbi:hypothetical protein IJH15_03590 [Candidatus Saccharibacteria bacterium]|nr:hypothetical protein [Candidatus Saccharibacteria bacterium]
MNPSYDSSFGSFSSGGTTSGGNAQQPIVLNNEKRKKPIKKIIITILLISLIIGGIVLAIVLFLGGKQRAKDEAEELYYTLSAVYSDSAGQCALVTRNADNTNRTKDEYKEMLDECQTKSDRVAVLIKNFENRGNTEEYRRLYTDLKNEVSEKVLSGETLKNRLAAYEVWHSFRLELDGVDLYQLSEDIEEIAKPLSETGIPELKQYAEQWVEKREALIETSILARGSSSDPVYGADYRVKLEEYESLVNKAFSEVAEGLRLDNVDSESDVSGASYLFNIYAGGSL